MRSFPDVLQRRRRSRPVVISIVPSMTLTPALKSEPYRHAYQRQKAAITGRLP